MPEVSSQNGAITKREKKEKISCCGCLTSGCEHLASAAKPGKGGFLVLLQFLTLALEGCCKKREQRYMEHSFLLPLFHALGLQFLQTKDHLEMIG